MPFGSKILVATDFSDSAQLAVDAAIMLAASSNAPLEIVHVFDPSAIRPFTVETDLEPSPGLTLTEELRTQAQSSLATIRDAAAKRVPSVRAEVIDHPSAARGICERAAETGADLIVVATHGRTGLKHMLIGSVAEQVVRFSRVPVLSLRSRQAD